MTTARRSQMSLAQRIALALLLLCMALAQSLGLAHRSLHADARLLAHTFEAQQALVHVDSAGNADHAADCDHGLFSRLFAGHEEGDETCRVMDGASAFLGLNSPLAGILPALYAHVLIAGGAYSLAAWQAPLFEARGPPLPSL
jgi:hypothetical protein